MSYIGLNPNEPLLNSSTQFESGNGFVSQYTLNRAVASASDLDVIVGKDGPQGLLKWDGYNPRIGIVTGVSSDLNIKKNKAIYTLGASGIFPKGLKIGTIVSKSRVEDQALWKIEVLFSEDYRTLQSVYVVNSLLQKELQSLQLEIPEELE